MTYIVSFSCNTEDSRLAVCNLLKTYCSYCPIHKNCWAVSADVTAVALRDKVQGVLHPGESVFVVRSGTEAAWCNTYGDANTKWLKENL